MALPKLPIPEAVPTLIVCSVCDVDWASHAEVDGKVSLVECIRLLKEKSTAVGIMNRLDPGGARAPQV